MKNLQLIPELLVEDMPRTLQFYHKILEFKSEITFPKKNPVFAKLGRDDTHIMFYERSAFEKEVPGLKKQKMGGSFLIFIRAEDIKSFYEQIQKKVNIIQPFHKTDYGTLEFTIE